MNVGAFLMQSCTKPGWEYLEQFEFLQAFTCTYAADIGFLAAGLIVWASMSLALYIKHGSPIIPLILMFQLGGIAISQVAAVATPIAVLLILVVPPMFAGLLYYRYS